MSGRIHRSSIKLGGLGGLAWLDMVHMHEWTKNEQLHYLLLLLLANITRPLGDRKILIDHPKTCILK